MDTVLITGSNYPYGEELAKMLNIEVVKLYHKNFPDGEKYIRIENPDKIKNRKAIIINTMYPSQNESFIETIMTLDAVDKADARETILIIPYLAYARQDKIFLPGEPITGEIIIKTFRQFNAKYLFTIDIHSPRLLEIYGEYGKNILVSDMLVEKSLSYVNNPILIAPDKGALNRVKYAAEKYGLEYDYLEKYRNRITGEITMKPKEIDVNGRDIVIIDDIISTGGTIAKASKILLEKGADKVVVTASHGLLIENALERIREAGVYKIILANTLNHFIHDPLIAYIDILPRIKEEVSEIL